MTDRVDGVSSLETGMTSTVRAWSASTARKEAGRPERSQNASTTMFDSFVTPKPPPRTLRNQVNKHKDHEHEDNDVRRRSPPR